MNRYRPYSNHKKLSQTLHTLLLINMCLSLIFGSIAPILAVTPVQAANDTAAAPVAAPPSVERAAEAPVAMAPTAPSALTGQPTPVVVGSSSITVTKQVNGSTQTNYTITVTGPSYPSGVQMPIISGTQVITGLAQGIYTVTETSPGAGWTTTYTATTGYSTSSSAVVTLTNSINAAETAAGNITGKVYRDFNSDGEITANGVITDTGVQTVTVTAYDRNGVQRGTTTTNASGNYTLTTTGTGPYRLEFTDLPTDYQPTAHGNQNGTSTQFASAGDTINVAINKPCDYCQADPLLISSVYHTGSRSNAPGNGASTLLAWPYSYTGQTPSATAMGTVADVGATWGLAYARTDKNLYAAAFTKRHVDIGPDGYGAIYVKNTTNASAPTLFATIPNAGTVTGRDITGPTDPSYDVDAFDKVGKVGLGGLAISDDEKILYTVNLNDRQLYAVSVVSPATMQAYVIPLSSCTSGTGEFRPFAVAYHQSNVYVGGVCDAQASQTSGDLKAVVYRFDTTSHSFTQVLTTPLNYPRGADYSGGSCSSNTGWYAWLATLPASCENVAGAPSFKMLVYPQPVLAGLAFDDDGSMLLGFFDRLGHQAAPLNYGLSGPDLYAQVIGGDILRACGNPTAGWTMENAGSCSGITGGGATGTGPGGGEFYAGDFFLDHQEISQGGVAIYHGSAEAVITAMDPIRISSGGVVFLDNNTGSNKRGYELYQWPGDPSTLNKSNGIGDVELLCDPAPLEIGNRVWNDINNNGIQDPGEPGINGVQVSVQSPTSTFTVNTSVDGNWYFTATLNTPYTITINSTPAGYRLTLANSAAISGSASSNHAILDTRDSDAVLVGGKTTIYYTTGGPGYNNHGLDIGFAKPASGQVDILNIYTSSVQRFGDRLWLEADGNGIIDVGETITPVVGHVLTATSSTGQVYNATTDSNGLYTFTVPSGTYTVTYGSAPSGYQVSSIVSASAVDNTSGGNNTSHNNNTVLILAAGDVITVVDFGFYPLGVVLPPPAVSIVKSLASPASGIAKPGDPLTYTLRIENTGSVALTSLTVVDAYEPAWLQYNSASITPNATASGVLTWTTNLNGQMPLVPGGVFTITVGFTATKP